MKRVLLVGALGTLSVFADPIMVNAREAQAAELTVAAASAVKKLFPRALLEVVGVEREGGVQYYEVAVREGTQRLEIEVTADGAIGEIETEVTSADLPQAARDGMLKSAAGAALREIERHEVRGVPKNGSFAAVDPPLVFYEAKYEAGGVWKEIAVAQDGSLLPAEDDDGEDD